MASKFFIIIISGRSGSSYLRELISQDDRVVMAGEMLASKSDREQKQIISDFFARKIQGEKYREELILGFKTKLTDISDRTYFLQQINLHQPTIIINRRHNYLKQAISRARMLVLVENTLKKYGKPHHSPRDKSDIVPAIKLDINSIYKSTRDFELRDKEIVNFSNNINMPSTTIYYEDFASTPQVATNKLSSSLGIDLQVDNYQVTYKNTSSNLKQAIKNYDELEARLTNSRFLTMLHLS